MYFLYLLICLLFSNPLLSEEQSDVPLNTNPFNYYIDSFSKSKKLLLQIYTGRNTTFYCGCTFDQQKNIDPSSCGYSARKSLKRGKRLEWEHVVPAHRFGKNRMCWQEPSEFERCIKKNGKTLSGRKCCRKVDPTFREMEADMLNLVPSVGELNGDRRNYMFDLIDGEARVYGNCDFEVSFQQKVAEPRPTSRGDIARIYFYFETRYQLEISDAERIKFNDWISNDPIDAWEKEKAIRIQQILVSKGKKRQTSSQFAEAE